MSFLSKRHIKATRKACRCDWCSEPIEIGQPKVYLAWMCDGFNKASLHPECDEANIEWWTLHPNADPEDADHLGRMKRGSTEEK